MMSEQGSPDASSEMNRNNTLEINPTHPIVIKLNSLRKKDSKTAGLIAKQFLDNVLMNSGIPYNMQESTNRNLNLLNNYLNLVTPAGAHASGSSNAEG